jgi:hypothetical protein
MKSYLTVIGRESNSGAWWWHNLIVRTDKHPLTWFVEIYAESRQRHVLLSWTEVPEDVGEHCEENLP